MGASAASTLSAMKTINAKASVTIPDNVKCELKSRVVKITGPRGVLTQSFRHMSVDMYMTGGTTKGFQYRMKMVYAHFPTNAQIGNGGKDVDIVNFIGQKVKFHIDALDGVKIERDPKENTQLLIHGNDIENVSRTCALINQACAVKKKDIRKFLDGIYASDKGFKDE